MSEKHWTEAKIPQWAQQSIKDDLRNYQITAALSWPTEAKPEPMPFRWVDYDRLVGDPVAGDYWTARVSSFDGTVTLEKVSIRKNQSTSWRSWEFSTNDKEWSHRVHRGPLFACEADARLFALWETCEIFAKRLARLRGWLQ